MIIITIMKKHTVWWVSTFANGNRIGDSVRVQVAHVDLGAAPD
jgi:hypothetical protein